MPQADESLDSRRHVIYFRSQYEAILKPKLTYAPLIWWKAIEDKTFKLALDRGQAVILKGIYGLRRSTPTAAIRMFLDIRETAARSAYRLRCSITNG